MLRVLLVAACVAAVPPLPLAAQERERSSVTFDVKERVLVDEMERAAAQGEWALFFEHWRALRRLSTDDEHFVRRRGRYYGARLYLLRALTALPEEAFEAAPDLLNDARRRRALARKRPELAADLFRRPVPRGMLSEAAQLFFTWATEGAHWSGLAAAGLELAELLDEPASVHEALLIACAEAVRGGRRRGRRVLTNYLRGHAEAKVSWGGGRIGPEEAFSRLLEVLPSPGAAPLRRRGAAPGAPLRRHTFKTPYGVDGLRLNPGAVEPTVHEDRLYLQACGRLFCFDADGKTVWQHEMEVEIGESELWSRRWRPAVADGLVFASAGARVVALKADSGEVVWRKVIPGVRLLSSPACDDGRLYMLGLDTERQSEVKIICLSASDGVAAYTRAICGGIAPGAFGAGVALAAPLIVDGRLFVQTGFEIAACYEATSGRPIWARRYGLWGGRLRGLLTGEPLPRPVVRPQAAHGGVVMAPPDAAEIILADVSGGRLIWREPSEPSLARVAAGRLVAAGERLCVYELDDGRLLLDAALPAPASSIAADGSAVWVAAPPFLVCLNVVALRLERWYVPELPVGCALAVFGGSPVAAGGGEIVFFERLRPEEKAPAALRRMECAELAALYGGHARRLTESERPIWRKHVLSLLRRRLEGAALADALKRVAAAERAPIRADLLLEAALAAAKESPARALATLSDLAACDVEEAHCEALPYLGLPEGLVALSLALAAGAPPPKSLSEAAEKACKDAKDAGPEEAFAVFLRYPWHSAAQRLALDAARAEIARGTTDLAERRLLMLAELPFDRSVRVAALRNLVSLYGLASDPVRARWARERLAALGDADSRRIVAAAPRRPDATLGWLPARVLWRTLPFTLDDHHPSYRMLDGDVPIVALRTEEMIELRRADDGTLAWRAEMKADDLAAFDGGVALVSGEEVVLAETKDGRVRWRARAGEPGPGGWRLLAVDDGLLLWNPGGKLLMLDKNGKEVFRREKGLPAVTAALVPLGDGFAALCDNRHALAFLDGRGATARTERFGGTDVRRLTTSAGRLFVATSDGLLRAYDRTGFLWRYKSAGPIGKVIAAPDGGALLLEEVPRKKAAAVRIGNDGKERWRCACTEEAPVERMEAAIACGRVALVWQTAAGVSGVLLSDAAGAREARYGFTISEISVSLAAGAYLVLVENAYQHHAVQMADLRRGVVLGTTVKLENTIDRAFARDQILYLGSRSGMTAALCSERVARVRCARAAARAALREEPDIGYAQWTAALKRADRAAEYLERRLLEWPPRTLQAVRALEAHAALRFWNAARRPPRHAAPRLRLAPEIDGRIDRAWRRARVVELRLPRHVLPAQHGRLSPAPWLGEGDISARLYMGWDRNNFYFLLDVDDDALHGGDTRDERYHIGDTLYLAMDPRNDGGMRERADDILIHIGLMRPQPNRNRQEEERKPKGVYMARLKEDETGIIYEAAIPWSYLKEYGTPVPKGGPAAGLVFGFNLVCMDDDAGVGVRKSLNLAPGYVVGRRDGFKVWRGFCPDAFAKIVLEGEK